MFIVVAVQAPVSTRHPYTAMALRYENQDGHLFRVLSVGAYENFHCNSV